MSGRRIDDHASFAGKAGKAYPLPEGNKMKSIAKSEGAGEVMDYPDVEEKIHRDQMAGQKKIKSHGMKPGYRY